MTLRCEYKFYFGTAVEVKATRNAIRTVDRKEEEPPSALVLAPATLIAKP